MKVVIRLSGGMDSVTALYEARRQHEVEGALSFHYGSKHNDREIPFAAYHSGKFGIEHRVIPLAFIRELFKSDLLASGGEIPEGHDEEQTMKKTVVPFRNGIMLSIAAGYAESLEADGLVIAAHAGDHAIYPDCREDFMKAMGEAIRPGTYARVEVLRPFIAMTKADIARRGREFDVDYAQTGRATSVQTRIAGPAERAWSGGRRSCWPGCRIRRSIEVWVRSRRDRGRVISDQCGDAH